MSTQGHVEPLAITPGWCASELTGFKVQNPGPHFARIRSDEGLTLETSSFRVPVRWSIYISIYSLSDLGVSSNLIGSLSRSN